MRSSSKIIPTSLIAVFLALFLTGTILADSDVTFTEGIVVVERDGTVGVLVCDENRDCELLFPSNGAGLLRAGQIADGDLVDVKIVADKGHKHRGHVTILK